MSAPSLFFNRLSFLGERGGACGGRSPFNCASTFGGRPTAQSYQPQPQFLGSGNGLGTGSQGFQFTIPWATSTSSVVEVAKLDARQHQHPGQRHQRLCGFSVDQLSAAFLSPERGTIAPLADDQGRF